MVAKGTNFHIKAYRDDSTVQVSLSEGRLEVQRDGIMLHDLKSGEVFTLHQDGNFDVFKPSNTGAAVTSASVNDGVFFDNKPISQIIQQIEKLYHKKIIVHGSSTDSLSLRLATQEKLEDVLRDIERAKPVHFDIYEDSVIMSHDQNP
jgi:ferric-dicitrate binding protein FerR (iron transport regulator)